MEKKEGGCRIKSGMTSSMSLPTITDLLEEFSFHEPRSDERYQMLIELGRKLEPMPTVLKTDATKVRGCASEVWLYPPPSPDPDRLHFLADSTSAFTKGVVALVLSVVQDRSAQEIASMDVERVLEPFGLSREFSSKRTQGIPNMIALIRDTAERLAA